MAVVVRSDAAKALRDAFISPKCNSNDSNLESASVVGGLYAIAKAIYKLAQAVEGLSTVLTGEYKPNGRGAPGGY